MIGFGLLGGDVAGALLTSAGALALDRALGDPAMAWGRHGARHPAAWMGRAVGALDRSLNDQALGGGARRARGVLALAALLVGAVALGALLARAAALAPPPLAASLAALLASTLLAQKSLVEHVRAVAEGLERGPERGLADGRRAVSMIVGRDPESLDEAGVARAAIESAAENWSDGVVAPALWLLVGGLPGLIAYKLVNTADSMIGHRTPRHEAFGWAAARLDDALNLAPARLSAPLIAAASALPRRALAVAWRDARLHASPNAGWPEAAMAGALGLSLAGPRRYQGRLTADPPLNAEGRRAADAKDIRAAIGVVERAWILLTLAIGACGVAAFLGG